MKRALSLIPALLLIAVIMTACGLFGAPKEELRIDKTELDMIVGDTAELSAGDAAKIKWMSDNESVATVHAGTVSAKSAGTANITVSLEDGASQTCKVTVKDKEISSISLSAGNIRLGLGKTVQITAAYSPADASSNELSWSSGDESVAVVDDKGFVTGVSDGSTEIVCSAKNGVKATCAVRVEEAPEQPSASPETMKPSQPSETVKASETPTKPSEASEPVSPAYSGDFVFPDSSTRYLSESEVRETLGSMTGTSVSGSFSQDAVNEIFARHGYVFRTASIRAYYESKSWYRENPNFDMDDITDIEEYNIAIFSKY